MYRLSATGVTALGHDRNEELVTKFKCIVRGPSFR